MSDLIQARVLLRSSDVSEEREKLRDLGITNFEDEPKYEYADFYFRGSSVDAFFTDEDVITLHFSSTMVTSIEYSDEVLNNLIKSVKKETKCKC